MIRLNLSKQERFFFIIAIITVILALSYNFIFEPTLKKWNSFNNEIIVKKTRLRKGLRLLEDRNTIIDAYTTYAAPIKDISKILIYIERQADSFGIKTTNIRPRPVAQKGLYREYTIELQFEAAFNDIHRFISQLIKPPRSITIKKFDLRAVGQDYSRLKGTLILSNLII